MTAVSAGAAPGIARCTRCRTELAPALLSCPSCHALVHADTLKELAASADRLSADGRLEEARALWYRAIVLLPPASGQVATIQARIDGLTSRLAAGDPSGTHVGSARRPWWKQGAAAIGAILIFALGKLKFLLIGLTKAKTFFSMFAFFGFYWTQFGWPLAAGIALSLYVHEMGHVHMLRRLGIDASAPLFIPGLGAFVLLKQHVTDALTDAKIGLAGPAWGLGAGIAAYIAFRVTGSPIWSAIAHITGFINLFNLIPIWQLDGSRGFHALSTAERWGAVAALLIIFLLTREKLLVVIAAVAIFRAFEKRASESGHPAVLAWFVGLAAAHALLAASAPSF